MHRGLRIAHLNIEGILGDEKMESFRLHMADKPFDVLGISETNIKKEANLPNGRFTLDGYHPPERKDRSTRLTHGVMVNISEDLQYKRRQDLENDKIDGLYGSTYSYPSRNLFWVWYTDRVTRTRTTRSACVNR